VWKARSFDAAVLCGETLKGRETSREDVTEKDELFGARTDRGRLEAWRNSEEGRKSKRGSLVLVKAGRAPSLAKTLKPTSKGERAGGEHSTNVGANETRQKL
jgi:hypothetical protein